MIRLLIIGIFYFPGTLFHELSHYLMAKILWVRVVGWSLIPKIKANKIEFGKVVLLKTDPLRSMLIALAPLLLGILISILLLTIYKSSYNLPIQAAFIYAFLCVVNMMIPSREDFMVAKTGIMLIILAAALGLLIYLFAT